MKEVDVARPVVEHFREMGLEVYQEVKVGDSVIDIVVDLKPALWVVEVKTSLSLDLLAQAADRKRMAHKVSIAVPKKKRRNRRYMTERFVSQTLRREGIGMFEVSVPDTYNPTPKVNEVLYPEFRRKVPDRLRKALHEDQKTMVEAGTAGGGHWTPFKQTCKYVLREVKKKPGITAKELVDVIEHHYASDSSAKSCLIQWGRAGTIPGVEVRKEGRFLTFHPTE